MGPPTAPHPPPPPTPSPPAHPPPIDSIRGITGTKKLQKPSSIQVACRNSYEMIAI